jgi:transcriptional regulator with XRE-family HTH domain
MSTRGVDESLLQMRRALGRQLAALRNRAGLSQWDLAPLTGYSRSALSDAELGRHRLRRVFWARCDELLKAEGQLVAGYDRIESVGPEPRAQARPARLAREAHHGSRVALEACPHCHRPIAVLIVSPARACRPSRHRPSLP